MSAPTTRPFQRRVRNSRLIAANVPTQQAFATVLLLSLNKLFVVNVEFVYSINSFVVYRLELLESYGHYLTTAPASTGGPSNHVTGKYRYLVALPTHSFAQASIP